MQVPPIKTRHFKISWLLATAGNPLSAHLDLFHLLPLLHTFTQEELSRGQLLVNLTG